MVWKIENRTHFMQSAEQYRVGQLEHFTCKCLLALTGQLSAYGNVIDSAPFSVPNRLMFSSAVSKGLSIKITIMFIRSDTAIKFKRSPKSTYLIQYSHAKYLQAAFHENWLDTKGSSCRIVSPFLKFTVENSARPYNNNSIAHDIIVIHTFLSIFQ